MRHRLIAPQALFAALLLLLGAARLQAQDQKFQRTNPQLLAAMSGVVEKASHYTVRIQCNDDDAALGTVVQPDGWIVTKASELKTEPTCFLQDGRKFPAKLMGVQKDYDLALLKIDASGLPVAEWKKSTDIEVGNWLATPGLGKEPLAVGVLSVARRDMPPPPRVVINPDGGYLGVVMADAESGVGVTVREVQPGTPASKAGIKVNDVVIKIDNKDIRDRESMLEILGKHKANDRVKVTVIRDDEEIELSVTLARRPANLDRGAFQNSMGSKLSERRTGFPVVFQHDTVLKPTDCGGPVVDLDGKVVGINIARAGRTESYAIPSEVVQNFIPELIAGKFPATALPKATTAPERLKAAESKKEQALADKARAEKLLKEAEDEIRKEKSLIESEKKKQEEGKKDDKKPEPKKN